MGKVVKFDVLEKIVPLIMILFFFLNYSFSTGSFSLFGSNAEFNRAVAFTLQHEGGLVDDKADAGGITNYGISYTFLSNFLAQNPQYLSMFSLKSVSQINPAIIKNLTLQQARQIYENQWWDKYNFGKLKDQPVAIKAFDYAVNMGPTPAIKLLQTACQNVSGSSNVTVDGQLDNSTINFINHLNSSQKNQLLSSYDNAACNYYYNLTVQHPVDKKFLSGWIKRADDINC